MKQILGNKCYEALLPSLCDSRHTSYWIFFIEYCCFQVVNMDDYNLSPEEANLAKVVLCFDI